MPERSAPSGVRAFRPPLWACLLTPLVMAVMVALGVWQLQRAAEKQQLQADFRAAMAQTPQILAAPAPPAAMAPQHVIVEGRYLPQQQFLLDSQIREGQAGVRVWTALQRSTGGIILVDRGWTEDPGRQSTKQWPVGTDLRQVQGLWRPLPAAGLQVANRLCEGAPAAAAPRVQYPTHAQLACAFEDRLADGLLLLHPQAADGFERAWEPDYLRPEVHWGYAVQWFAFALAVFVIFVVVNWKKR
ncbi:SURF1 family protein [Algiphilus sp.]|uniref:SURF1 family protein n=1 Tax=Algiphilus sp. TaxID=1872431 RepID=UPI003BA93276